MSDLRQIIVLGLTFGSIGIAYMGAYYLLRGMGFTKYVSLNLLLSVGKLGRSALRKKPFRPSGKSYYPHIILGVFLLLSAGMILWLDVLLCNSSFK